MSPKPVQEAIDRYFVQVWLDTNEQPDKRHLENAGAEHVLKFVGGDKQGMPFIGILDASGKLIVNSMRPGTSDKDKGGNTGCPYAPEEIDWFMKMLAKASPKMAEADKKTIRTAFEELSKKKPTGG